MTNGAEAAMEATTEGCLFNVKKIWMFKKPKPTKQNINKKKTQNAPCFLGKNYGSQEQEYKRNIKLVN